MSKITITLHSLQRQTIVMFSNVTYRIHSIVSTTKAQHIITIYCIWYLSLKEVSVHLHHQCQIQLPPPHLMKDTVELREVQRKAVNMMKETEQLSYKERLKRLGLCLGNRRHTAEIQSKVRENGFLFEKIPYYLNQEAPDQPSMFKSISLNSRCSYSKLLCSYSKLN